PAPRASAPRRAQAGGRAPRAAAPRAPPPRLRGRAQRASRRSTRRTRRPRRAASPLPTRLPRATASAATRPERLPAAATPSRRRGRPRRGPSARPHAATAAHGRAERPTARARALPPRRVARPTEAVTNRGEAFLECATSQPTRLFRGVKPVADCERIGALG